MNNFAKIFGVVILAAIAAMGVFAMLNYSWSTPAASGPSSPSATMSPTSPLVDEQPTAAVNDRCPITGKAVDPAKVPADLTREFKGQKVGFCCGGCPATWDKLPEPEKQAKLDKVKIGN